jgi:hypothetical protein
MRLQRAVGRKIRRMAALVMKKLKTLSLAGKMKPKLALISQTVEEAPFAI